MKAKTLLLTLGILTLLMSISMILGEATCVAGIGEVVLTCPNRCSFDVNTGLTNLTLQYNQSVTAISQPAIYLYLCKADATIANCVDTNTMRISVITNVRASTSNTAKYCTTTSNCFSLSSKLTSGGYKIISVIDPSGVKKINTFDISIKPTLLIKDFSCGTGTGFVDRDITCSWKVVDASTSSDKTGAVIQEVNVVYNKQNLSADPLQGKVTFKVPGAGEALINLKVDLITPIEYIGTSGVARVTVQEADRTQKLFIDDKSKEQLTTIVAGTTAHKLTIKVDESGVPVDVDHITAEISLPAGCPATGCSVKFNKVGLDWIAYYTFDLPSQTYTLSGTVSFVDVNKPELQFSYPITTTAESAIITPEDYTLYFIIGGIVLFSTIIVFLFIIFGRRKK